MIKVILTKGLPASGKSTWAKKLIDENPNAYKRINKDDLRAMLDNDNFTGASEKFILKVRNELILLSIKEGKHVIVDDTNLNPKHEMHIRELVKGIAEVSIQDFTSVPLEECIKRDLKRVNTVGEKRITEFYNQYLRPAPEKIEYINDLPDVVICDLDGTLCNLNGRNPYDASECENDGLNTVVYDLINKEANIIFVSGREDKYREQTISFLKKHHIQYAELHMRATDDFRKDSIIKREIFDNHIRGKSNVKYVLDDRNQVVEMWRQLGLICLQVAEGNF